MNGKLVTFTGIIVLVLLVAIFGFLFWEPKPEYIQGEAEATEVRISGKVPGRIEICLLYTSYPCFTSLYFRYFPEYDQFRAGCRSDECISEDYCRYFCDDRSLVVYSVFYRRYGR